MTKRSIVVRNNEESWNDHKQKQMFGSFAVPGSRQYRLAKKALERRAAKRLGKGGSDGIKP